MPQFAISDIHGCAKTFDALLKINAARMFAEGHRFFCSENGVWLTDRVPPAFIQGAEPDER